MVALKKHYNWSAWGAFDVLSDNVISYSQERKGRVYLLGK